MTVTSVTNRYHSRPVTPPEYRYQPLPPPFRGVTLVTLADRGNETIREIEHRYQTCEVNQ